MSKPSITLEPVFDPTTAEWLIASANNPLASYRVSLTEMTCSCPHHVHRLGPGKACKHIVQAREAAAQEQERQQARRVLRICELETELKALFR